MQALSKSIRVTLTHQSLFDLNSGKSVAYFKINGVGKLYRADFSGRNTPEFLTCLYKKLNPLQGAFEYLTSKVFKDRLFSSLIFSPTSSGKTGIILIYANHVLSSLKKEELKEKPVVVYVAPLKALIREKFEEMQKVFGKTVVEMKTGDDLIKRHTVSGKILVCTSDYLSLAIRNKLKFTENVKAIIVDEVHTIFKSEDKPALDEILWFIKEKNVKYLALSATIPFFEKFIEYNTPDFILESTWRPVPLEKHYAKLLDFSQFVLNPRECAFGNKCDRLCGISKTIVNLSKKEENKRDSLAALISLFHFVSQKKEIKKIIFFVPSKRSGWDLLEALNEHCKFNVINADDDLPFAKTYYGEDAPIAGFHCADLSPAERVKIEKEFKKDPRFVLLVATHSLAYGINLPADASVVLVKGTWYQGEFSMWPSLMDCIQMGGRAGRFGFSEKGYVYYAIKGSYNLVTRYLKNPENFPFEKELKSKNLENVIAGGIFFCLKRGLPITKCTENSFLLFASEVELKKVVNVFRRLRSMGYVLQHEDGSYTLSQKGEFCYRSGISPFTLAIIEILTNIFLNHTNNVQLKSYLKFLPTVLFSGSRYDSTLKNFVEVQFGEKTLSVSILERILTSLPDWNLLKKFLEKEKIHFISPHGFSYVSENSQKDVIDVISFILQTAGIYYYMGMPKVCSDLGYVSPSSVLYYVRNLYSLSNYLGEYSIPEIFVFTHMLKYKVPFWVVIPVLFAKKRKLDVGQVKTNVLNLALQKLNFYYSDFKIFFKPENLLEDLKNVIANNKEEFLNTVEEIVSRHVAERHKFKKTVDAGKIKSEIVNTFKNFVKTIINFNASKNTDFLEYEIYDTFICEVFKKAVFPEVTKKNELIAKLKIHLIAK